MEESKCHTQEWFNPEDSRGKLEKKPLNVVHNNEKGGVDFTEPLDPKFLSKATKFMLKNMLKGRFTMDLPIDLCLDQTTL